jgi:hypothetical protein
VSRKFRARLALVDADTLAPLVRRSLGDEAAIITHSEMAPLTAGYAGETVGGRGVYRFSGEATSHGATRSWSLILKVLGKMRGIGSTDPVDWDYWRREILAYQSGLLENLPGISAPRCLGVVEYPGNEFWIWLEEVTDAGNPNWDMADYARAARDLGRFNGAYLTGAMPLPDHPWLTRGRVASWLALGADVLADLPAHLAGRTRRHWLSAAQTERVEALWAGRAPLLAALDRLPRSLCHHDAFRRNLFGGPRTTAIDWQIVGTGAVSEELMPLVAISLQFMNVPVSAAPELEANVLAGYLEGLRDAGWHGDERLVRFGYAAATGLFAGVATVGMWQSLSDASGYQSAEGIFGHPIDAIIDTWSELQDHFLDLGEEALTLADAV